jgi:hypothetical protein
MTGVKQRSNETEKLKKNEKNVHNKESLRESDISVSKRTRSRSKFSNAVDRSSSNDFRQTRDGSIKKNNSSVLQIGSLNTSTKNKQVVEFYFYVY